MKIFWRSALPALVLAGLIGCSGTKPSVWGQFQGDLASRGFQPVKSGFALSFSWTSNPYRITSSSPVIGKDFQNREVIYVGTVDGKLVAIRSENGSQKWQRALGESGAKTRIVSSAAVSAKGDIYVITNHPDLDGRLHSTLHKVDQFSNLRWSYTFPDNGFTTGSPKVFLSGRDTLVLVYVTVGTAEDIQGELFVLGDAGKRAELLDRKALAACRYDAPGNEAALEKILSTREVTWYLLSAFPIEFEENESVWPDRFVEPTVAVVTGTEKPLIAVADNLCSIGVFEWNGSELSVLWREEHRFFRHSSAAVLPNGLMVFGRQDGKVLAYDVQTGVKMWEYDADGAVLTTPAAFEAALVFVVSGDNIQALKTTDGSLIRDETFEGKLPFWGMTFSSPAVTSNRVYVSAFEMLTVTHDLKTRGHDTNFQGNGMASMAVGRDGAIYAVAADGTVRKYAGTE